MFMGIVTPERLKDYADFMYSSEHTKALRDEYHLVIRDQTAEEKCYILSPGEEVTSISDIPKTLHQLYERLGIKTPLASGGIASGPSFGNTDHHAPEMVVPIPNPAEKLRAYLDQIIPLRAAAMDIAKVFGIPDSKISENWPKSGYTPKEAREMEEKSTVKDPEEKASFFGYKIRRSTMQDLESLMLTGGHASFKASDDGEIFITHAFPRGL